MTSIPLPDSKFYDKLLKDGVLGLLVCVLTGALIFFYYTESQSNSAKLDKIAEYMRDAVEQQKITNRLLSGRSGEPNVTYVPPSTLTPVVQVYR